jgi:hypothetical protein
MPELERLVPTPTQKIEILKLVYTEEAQALRFEVTTAQRLMTYFVTLELALGAWLAANPISGLLWRLVVFGLNATLGIILGRLMVLNYRRRKDVVDAQRGAIEALGLISEGEYLPGRVIHAWRYNASWKLGYLILMGFFCLAQSLPLFLWAK